MHSLAFEVRSERPVPARSIQESFVSVSAECTRQHTDVSEYALCAYSLMIIMCPVMLKRITSRGLSLFKETYDVRSVFLVEVIKEDTDRILDILY